MSTVLAVQLSESAATFITAKAESGRPITLLDVFRVPRAAAGEEQPPAQFFPNDFEIDDTVGLLESDRILYNVLELPFRDAKKIDQVAALQIQDFLPFDLEEFLVDSIVASAAPAADGSYRILSSLIPKQAIAETLAFCESVGAEPRIITTGAAALCALAKHCHPDQTGLQAYIELTRSRVSLAILLDGRPLHFRDFPIANTPTSVPIATALADISRNIACSLAKCEGEQAVKLGGLFTIGNPEKLSAITYNLSVPPQPLSLEELVVNDSPEEVELEEITWSLGLFAAELQRSRRGDRQMLDFRRGQFAFHRVWQEVWAALQQELFYVSLAILLGVVWWGGRWYTEISALHRVDNKIAEVTAQVLPGEAIPYRAEVSYAQSKLDTLEEDLRGLGSLSSLSPLEAIKELSAALGSGYDVALDSVSVGPSRVLLRGSVAENRQVAEVSAALKARHDQFCEVKVEPKGKTASSRVGFTAELTLCE